MFNRFKTALTNYWKKFKKKSRLQKATDFALVGLIILLLVPNGRTLINRLMVQTGVYNVSINFDKKSDLSIQDWTGIKIYNSNGETKHLSDFKGQVIILHFWATWCPPCKAELPTWSNLYGKLRDNPEIEMLFITNEDPTVVTSFLESWESNLHPAYLITNSSKSLQPSALPTTYIIDKNGNILVNHTGMAKWDTEDIYQHILSLISE